MLHLPRWIACMPFALVRLFRPRCAANRPRTLLRLELLSSRVLFSASPLGAVNLIRLPHDALSPVAASRSVDVLESADNGASSHLHASSTVPATQERLDSLQQFPSLPPTAAPADVQNHRAVEAPDEKGISHDLSFISGVSFYAADGQLDYHQQRFDYRFDAELADGNLILEQKDVGENATGARRAERAYVTDQAPMQNPQGATPSNASAGAVGPLLMGVMNGSHIADALDGGDDGTARTSEIVEVSIQDADTERIALVTVSWDLPEARQQLISLEEANRALAPAYVVGDGRGAETFVAPVETREDLNLCSVVVGLDEPLSAVGGRFSKDGERRGWNAATDRVFQEVGNQRLDAVSVIGVDTGPLVSQWGDLLADLPQSIGEQGKAAGAILAEALLTFGVWRLTNRAVERPNPYSTLPRLQRVGRGGGGRLQRG